MDYYDFLILLQSLAAPTLAIGVGLATVLWFMLDRGRR